MIPGQVLQVLLVGGDADLRESAEKALSGWPGSCVLYWVSQLDLALVRAQDVQPRVILLDVSSDGPAGLQLIGQMAARFPLVAMIALVPADAIDRAREVVLAGAGAFVTLPLEPVQLLASLRQVLSQPVSLQRIGSPEHGRGRVIAFVGPKGGAGRTTLAINTAISLLQTQGQPVVLMDADYAAPALDVALNLRSPLTIADLLPRISRLDADLLEPVLLRHSSGIRLLLAPPPGQMQTLPSPPHVQQVLGWLRRLFPWVVVDVGLPLDELTFAVLDGADRLVQVAMPEMVGIRNGRLMLDHFSERGYPSDKVWLVLNRANLSGGLPVAAIEERLGHVIRHLLPDDQVLATETINRGQPFVVAHARSPIARACTALARDLVRSFAATTDAEAAPGPGPAPVAPDMPASELPVTPRGLLPVRTGLPRPEMVALVGVTVLDPGLPGSAADPPRAARADAEPAPGAGGSEPSPLPAESAPPEPCVPDPGAGGVEPSGPAAEAGPPAPGVPKPPTVTFDPSVELGAWEDEQGVVGAGLEPEEILPPTGEPASGAADLPGQPVEPSPPTAFLDEFPPLAAATIELEPIEPQQLPPEPVASEPAPPLLPETEGPELPDSELASPAAPAIESSETAPLAVPQVESPAPVDSGPAQFAALVLESPELAPPAAPEGEAPELAPSAASEIETPEPAPPATPEDAASERVYPAGPGTESPELAGSAALGLAEAAAASAGPLAGGTPETSSSGPLLAPVPASVTEPERDGLAQRSAFVWPSRWLPAGVKIGRRSQIAILVLAVAGIALLMSIPIDNRRQAAGSPTPVPTATVPAATLASLAGSLGAGVTPSASPVPATATARPGISVPTTVAATPAPATAPPTATALPIQAPTAVPAPSATAVPPTPPPAPTPRPATRAIPPTPVPTTLPTSASTARPRSFGLSVPAYEAPAPNAVLSGNVTFHWLPTGPLPAGAGYEVVWWNPGEDPSAARGLAPITTGPSQVIDIGVLYQSHQMTATSIYWAVLLVQPSPYQRLTQPASSNPQLLTYRP